MKNDDILFILTLLALMFMGFALGVLSANKRITNFADTNKAIYINGNNYLIYKE